jgi:outer membrane lipoprotein LolB
MVGCASKPQIKSTSQEPLELASLTRWHASGRMAVSGNSNGGSGSFEWQQDGDTSEIHLRGPVGIGSLRVKLQGDSLLLESGDGVMQAEQAQAQLNARLGAEVPLKALRFWMLGIAVTKAATWNTTTQGRTLDEMNWMIDYQRFIEARGIQLPTKWVAHSQVNNQAHNETEDHPVGNTESVKVRVVVDRWTLQ